MRLLLLAAQLGTCLCVEFDAKVTIDKDARVGMMRRHVLKSVDQDAEKATRHTQPIKSSFKFYRFTVLKTRGSDNYAELAEFSLHDGEHEKHQNLSFTNVLLKDEDGQTILYSWDPNLAVDGSLRSKVRMHTHQSLLIEVNPNVQVGSFGFTTGGDDPARDPVAFTFEGSDDGEQWLMLSNKEVNFPTRARGKMVGPFVLSTELSGGKAVPIGQGEPGQTDVDGPPHSDPEHGFFNVG